MKEAHGWQWPDHEVHMLEWIGDPKNRVVINDRAAYQGKKQLATLRHCRSFRSVIDVGAHVGLWSYNLAHAFEQVHAFEPVKDHRMCFQVNVTKPNVKLYPFALGNTPGMVSIRTTKGSSGDSVVNGEGDIEMYALDQIALKRIDLLKVDCEGYEENVLRGAAGTITQWKPTIIVEQKHKFAERFGLNSQGGVEFLKTLGYKVVEEISGDYILNPT
jgi:FkbM family methyltransferase